MTNEALKVYEKAESLDEELFNKYNETWYESLVKNHENNPNHKIHYVVYDEDKTNPVGSKYIGEFQNGLWHGKGEYQSPDGSSQKGDYQNGIFQPDDT